jgi:hypothetical protein
MRQWTNLGIGVLEAIPFIGIRVIIFKPSCECVIGQAQRLPPNNYGTNNITPPP